MRFVGVIFLLIVMTQPALAASLDKRRVWLMLDGTVVVTMISSGACYEGEAEDNCFDRIINEKFSLHPVYGPMIVAEDFMDIDKSALPPRADRKYWTGSRATGIQIDETRKAADAATIRAKDAARAKLKALGLTDKELDALGIR